jgi:hypothetical protein
MLRNIAVAAIVIVFLLAQGPQAWSTVRSWIGLNDWAPSKPDAVTAPERAQELAAKGLREQLISFGEGMVPLQFNDRANPRGQRYDVYVIGVGQLSLDEPEKVTVTGSRIPTWPGDLPDVDTVPTYPLTGQFNNVIIFDRRTGELTKLFDKRLAISQFQYGWRTKPEVLVIFATERDTNKDAKLDDNDLHDIYIYTFADRQMHKIDIKSIRPMELMDIPDADYIVVKALVDLDEDGKALEYRQDDENAEPVTLIRVDLKTFAATPFIPDPMQTDLQKTLDGPKPPASGGATPQP